MKKITIITLCAMLFCSGVLVQTTVAQPASPQAKGDKIIVPLADDNSLFVEITPPPPVEIKDIFEGMSQGKKPGIKAFIPNANIDALAKNWSAHLKNFGGKTKTKDGVIFTDNAAIASLSENTIDIYSDLGAYPGGVFLRVFFDLGGAYINKNEQPQKLGTAKQLIQEFAVAEAARQTEQKLSKEESELQKLDATRKDLKNNTLKLQEEVERLKKTIANLERTLELNAKLMEQKDIEAQEQINAVEQLKFNLQSILTK